MEEAKPAGEKVTAKNVIVRMVRSAKRGTGELMALLLKSECSTARNLEFDSRCRELLFKQLEAKSHRVSRQRRH
jgi:hypothetical protein